MFNNENHRCYSDTRQHMLMEINRLDAEIKDLSRYKIGYTKLKKKYDKVVMKLHKLNIVVSKMLSDV